MELVLVEEAEIGVLEGQPEAAFINQPDDTRLLIEQCFAYGAHAVLLYAPNLPRSFFDLSSGFAGNMLQQLQNYHLRLAVVCPPGSVALSQRFGELLAETQRAGDFGVFASRDEARAWLAQP